MKSFTYDELKDYVEKEINIPNNPRVVLCHNRINKENILKFIIANEDIRFFRPWRGYAEVISKGDYISTVPHDIYSVKSYVFNECYVKIPSDTIKEP